MDADETDTVTPFLLCSIDKQSVNDSGISSDYSTGMESLTSSNYIFREINGRRSGPIHFLGSDQ